MAASVAEVALSRSPSPANLTEDNLHKTVSDGETDEILAKVSAEVGEYEKLFRERYTDEDSSYVEGIKTPITVPPLINPWYNKPRRNFDYGNNRRRGGSGDHYHHHRGRWSGNRGHQQHQGRHVGNNNYYKNQQQRPNRDNRYQPY